MAAKRFYYSDSISDFLEKSTTEIIGELTLSSSTHDINEETIASWKSEIDILRGSLGEYRGRGSMFFEYNIPRMGRRADVIAVIENVVFVLEFKTAESEFTLAARNQAWDYALDLKNFQEGCLDRILIPIVVAPNEKNRHCCLELKRFKDNVYVPLLTNEERLRECIDNVIASVPHCADCSADEDELWATSGYEPTPTIIEAAIALYEENTVEDITKHSGNIEDTAHCIERIVSFCRANKRKAICFVTGVPGAGKTLIGLQTAIDQFKKGEKAVYLSGNFPLVQVLQEALTRDYVRREKYEYTHGLTTKKPCSKSEAKSKVKAFIQMIHHYRDYYLESAEIVNGEIVRKPNYNATGKAYVPTEHVAIFDEAQRAWTKDELAFFMKRKKHIDGFPYSEPEYLISCMDRHQDWGLVVCLIGGGQEINSGEAGIKEWLDSMNRRFNDWDIYISDKLTEREYAGGKALNIVSDKHHVYIEPALHLSVSMRSFRAEKVSLFVHQLLELDKVSAAKTLEELENYPMVITRSLDTAKRWLKEHARGTERYGLLASSKAERLKAISINVRYQPDFVHWFLEDDKDIRSSNCLEDTLTEFQVQGLEVDWACVAWDADLRLSRDHTRWQHYQLRSGTKWQNINKDINKTYQLNAYRVLLTRARQGMVIVVPSGDTGVPPDDETRRPEYYDSVYAYLKEIGLKEVE
jgi:hypothetical protein